jgi:chloramphenicol 3-O phosphotransferase
MLAAVAACARVGNDMLVDDVFVDRTWLDGWRSELAGLRWLLVAVVAPLGALEERERTRGNRVRGEARAQVDVIHRNIAYDLTVDTERVSPEECARAILAELPTGQTPPNASETREL